MKTLWQEGTSLSQTKQVSILACQIPMVAKSRTLLHGSGQDSSLLTAQQTAGASAWLCCFLSPKAPCPNAMAWSATEEPRAQSSSPFIASSKQTGPLPPENKQFLGSGCGHLDLTQLPCDYAQNRLRARGWVDLVVGILRKDVEGSSWPISGSPLTTYVKSRLGSLIFICM